MRVYYCTSCGKRIPLEEIQENQAVEIDGLMYCSECAEAQIPAEEVEATPDGPVRCDKCGSLIRPADLQSGKAVSAGGRSYCAKCTAMYLPLLEALKENGSLEELIASSQEAEAIPEGPVHCDRCNALIDVGDLQSGKAVSAGGHSYCAKCTSLYLPLLEALKEKETHEEPVRHHRRRTPGYGMRAVTAERPAEPRAPVYEKKSNALPVIGVAAGVVILVVILAVAMSGGPGRTTTDDRQPGGGHVARPPAPPLPPPEIPVRHETPKFTEDPRAKQAIKDADTFAREHSDEYEAIISRYEHIEKAYTLSSYQKSHVDRTIAETIQRRRHNAEAQRDRVLAEANKLEEKSDYAGALAALQDFPENLKAAEDCWRQVQERIDSLERDGKARGPFETLQTQVAVFKKQEKEQEAIAQLKKFVKDYAGSSFAARAQEMIAQFEEAIEKRKEAERQVQEEAKKKLEAERDRMRDSEPLYFADFTGKELKANINVRYKDCKYPYDSGQGSYTLRVQRRNASVSFEFSLLEKPKHAALFITHIIPLHREATGHVDLTFELNGTAIAKDKRYTYGEAAAVEEFDVAEKLVKGKNKLTVTETAGNVGWVLERMELRAYYEDKNAGKKEREHAKSRVSIAQAEYKKWLSAKEKEKERGQRKLIRKFEHGALPALKPGKTYDLLKSKSLKGWKIWGEGGEWKFENGVLVGRNNVIGKDSAILTTHYKRMHEWKDYVLTIKFTFENSSEHEVLLRACYPEDKKDLPGNCLVSNTEANGFPLGKEIVLKVLIAGDKANCFVDGTQTVTNHNIQPDIKNGFVGIRLGPNATVRIKEMTLELKR